MSMLVASFRSHFFKHLACTSFSSIRTTSKLTHGSNSMLIGSSSTREYYPSRKLKDFLNLGAISAASFSTSASEPSTTGSYLSVDIQCRQDVADMLSEALLCFGAVSTSMVEPDTCDSNDEISIGSIFTVTQDVHRSISQAADSIGLKETPVYKVTVGHQSDWIENSRECFHPIEVTEGLWIVPEWITPPLGFGQDLEATIISLNPGLAFGTGDHPTTKLCLLLLHGLIKGGEKVLDYGTGSGILAIAALKVIPHYNIHPSIHPDPTLSFSWKRSFYYLRVGVRSAYVPPHMPSLGGIFWAQLFGHVTCSVSQRNTLVTVHPQASSRGLDIDPQAITAARHNADLNNIGPDKLQLQLLPNNTDPLSTDQWQWAAKGNETAALNGVEMISEKETYDVVVANILLNPLLDLADEIVSYAKPGAVVALSGIILDQIPTVTDRYSNLLEGMTVSEIDDWACISGTKRKVKE
ncbi:hypothetical protein OSB04_007999 [Centaurea solstitialis]|uniref:ETFB lysine methyltransferase n=1 Tax=Centaurea solstitialis TaxID=347529 RepID=A0AA38TMN1_9ASTR|nr:hypothetical protein OSB04_007999 [Centaurea solstitialis]